MNRLPSFTMDQLSDDAPLGASDTRWLSEPDLSLEAREPPSPLPPLPHLPDNVVRIIASHVLESSPKSCSLITLLAMCGVCKQWRSAASHLEPSAHLHFDGSKQISSAGSPLEQMYRRCSAEKRGDLLISAAQLFQGYGEATVTGDAVTDKLLTEIAHHSRSSLTRITIAAAPEVTDIGIGMLALMCQRLQHLSVSSISPKDAKGAFLRKVMELPALETLELSTPLMDMYPHQDDPYYGRYGKGLDMSGWPTCKLTTLRLFVNGVDTSCCRFFSRLPHLKTLELDCGLTMEENIKEAQKYCPSLQELHIHVDSADILDRTIPTLATIKNLKVLEVTVASFVMSAVQLRGIGELVLEDLRLMSQVYKKQPSLSRLCCSHLDNAGVKALVDAICIRSFKSRSVSPLKLSICGASMLSHDAVSALLRLPMLVKLDVSGCNRISAMDKMRLIAKVKAGREQRGSNPLMFANFSPCQPLASVPVSPF